jgi:quercetin dioxygenase-like cupin family protein
MMIRASLIGVAALVLGSAAQSQINPAGLKWGPAPPGLPKGAQLALLSGNPETKGLFTIRLRFPAGYTVPPHHHTTDEHVTVMSGKMALGMGA